MNILVTQQKGANRDIYFPDSVVESLEKLGDVRFNESDKAFTKKDLIENIRDIDVLLTHWSCPYIDKEVLENAPGLKLIAHAAGSAAYVVGDCVYEKGIKVCSSNPVMAKFVAEGVLAYMLSGLRLIPQHDSCMKQERIWNKRNLDVESLYGARVGLIGLGTVGRYLLKLLKPFQTQVRIYDPYITDSELKGYSNAVTDNLENVLSWGDIISLHASLTKETYHLIDEKRLGLIQDSTLFVNTSRGKIVDEKALVQELKSGRINAVLDVFEQEPLPVDSELRNLDNVILIPHMAGCPAREKMTHAIIKDIERFINGEPLELEVPYEKYRLMTRNVN